MIIFLLCSVFLVSLLLSLVLFLVSFFFVSSNFDIEKISIYECGFDPFDDTILGRFDIRFYLVSILFLIFDIEVIFLFPWGFGLIFNWVFWFFNYVYFSIFVNFRVYVLYEWFRGALEWA